MDDELFKLDELDESNNSNSNNNHSNIPNVSFSLGRFNASFDGGASGSVMKLDEFDEEDEEFLSNKDELLRLLRKDKDSVSVTKGLTSSFCEWLVETGTDEEDVLRAVQKFSGICLDSIEKLRERLKRFGVYGSSAEKQKLEQELELLLGECGTWDLLFVTLSDDRKQQNEINDAMMYSAAKDKWTSDERLFYVATQRNVQMRRWRRTVGWLERIYNFQTQLSGPVRNEHYWEETTRSLNKGISIERDLNSGSENKIISKLDPDCPLREKSAKLCSHDQLLDNRLLKRVWELIRCGKIGQAINECNSCQQQWRSAVLMGMQSYHDPKIENEKDPSDARGNCNSSILRQSCLLLSENDAINQYERAMYAVFCGNMDPVLAVCRTFHDYLWCCYKNALLQKVLQLRGNSGIQSNVTDEEILEKVSVMKGMEVETKTPFVMIQQCLILGNVNELVQLLTQFQAREDCPSLIHRFSANCLLVLSKVKVQSFNPSPELVLGDAQKSIEIYLDRFVSDLDKPSFVVSLCSQLSNAKKYSTIAKYIAKSIETKVSSETLEMESSSLVSREEQEYRRKAAKQERRLTYIKALEAGDLDTVEVLKLVVKNLLPPAIEEPQAFNFNHKLVVERDYTFFDGKLGSHLSLVEVLGWLTIRKEHWKESVLVANSIARQLALHHRVSHLKDVLNAIPMSTIDRCRSSCIADRANASFAFEIEFWKCLSDSYNAFQMWHSFKTLRNADFAEIYALYEGAETALRRVVDFPEAPLFVDGSDVHRHKQLLVIRQSYIPQVFTMLHYLHFESKRFDLSLSLSDDVADQRRGLWKLFVQTGMLEHFLNLMRNSSVALLKNSHRDFLGFDDVLN